MSVPQSDYDALMRECQELKRQLAEAQHDRLAAIEAQTIAEVREDKAQQGRDDLLARVERTEAREAALLKVVDAARETNAFVEISPGAVALKNGDWDTALKHLREALAELDQAKGGT